ncbi:DUF3237 domain-containing protein [Parageobacillus sp. VR-IP]|uniref:DUF3237 family protein n=1 Tax=Parageobacillus sp. VR-IP TaxID=2742205 RepID=UPI0015839563|nr:DUF3237 family protein [Parageobacillus sp. VR-IP]NUK31369.1 DUF3237 domain-containing protein [Parageobacillus sp. VR-IP]
MGISSSKGRNETIEMKHIFTANIKIEAPIEIGGVETGIRGIIPVSVGTFDSPALKGTVLPGGADYQLIRYDGVDCSLYDKVDAISIVSELNFQEYLNKSHSSSFICLIC